MTFDERLSKPIQTDSDFAEYVKSLYDEWAMREQGGYTTAEQLVEYVNGIECNIPPQFFAGRLDSPIALVSLNPHAGGTGSASEVLHLPFCTTWDSYWEYWQNFGRERGAHGRAAF